MQIHLCKEKKANPLKRLPLHEMDFSSSEMYLELLHFEDEIINSLHIALAGDRIQLNTREAHPGPSRPCSQ